MYTRSTLSVGLSSFANIRRSGGRRVNPSDSGASFPLTASLTITSSPSLLPPFHPKMAALLPAAVPDPFDDGWPEGEDPPVLMCIDPDSMSSSVDRRILRQVSRLVASRSSCPAAFLLDRRSSPVPHRLGILYAQ